MLFLSKSVHSRQAPAKKVCRLAIDLRCGSGALNRAGVESPRKGAQLFRHSLAMTMIRQAASLDEIGELLRHRSPNTTAIYAKVDLPALRLLAPPWPGGAR
jgi:site-specific recombinase XerD